MRIRVDPDHLCALATELQRIGEQLQRLSQQVGNAPASLDWETRHSLGVEGHAAHARHRARMLAEQANGMSRWLMARAQAFAEADAYGAQEIERIARILPLPHSVKVLPVQPPRLGWPLPPVRWIRLPRMPILVIPRPVFPRWPRWFIDRMSRVLPWLKDKISPAHPSMPQVVFPSIRLPDGHEIPIAELGKRYPLGMPPVSSVSDVRQQYPVNAEITSSPESRHREIYNAVINQFGVKRNPRYVGPQTYCNIFVSDVTRAMGVEIPHWVDKDGKAVQFSGRAEPGWRELNVQGMRAWLQEEEGKKKWRRVSAEEAQQWANSGRPAVVLDPGGTHIGVIRPEEMHPSKGPALAQAGKDNFGNGYVLDGFGVVARDYNELEYYVAD